MTTNGGNTTNGGDENEYLQLPEHRQRQVEAAAAYHQSILAQRDDLDGRLSEALKDVAGLKIQVEAMQGIHNMMESSIVSHRVERDQAVARAAKLEAVIENVFIVVNSALKKVDPS